MIDKTNIKIESKNTKKIYYKLFLDRGYWYKREYDSEGKQIYFENSSGFWHKKEYNTRGNEIYFENYRGFIRDDRTN
jgi:outer membrane lipoprotein-sorting protein